VLDDRQTEELLFPEPQPATAPAKRSPLVEKLLQVKATFEECVQAVMDQPGFEPQGDRTPEESARAICATKPGGPQEGKAADEPGDELSAVRAAILSENPDTLPPGGRVIFDRMLKSATRFAAGRYPDAYPRAVAWYAIRRKYHLEAQKGGAGHATAARTPAGRKTASSFPVDASGGGWIVRLGESTPAADAAWDRTDTVPVPWQQGANLTVGYSNGQATITAVFVPGSAVKYKDESGPAMRWVREHWDLLWRLGKHSGGLFTQGKRAPFTRFAKFVLTPESATRQIAYGVAYPAWEVDLQGQWATADEVERMAHNFAMNQGRAGEMHSRFETKSGEPPYRIVETFIAPPGHPHFQADDWIVGAKFADEVWERVKAGTYKGFSIAGNWGRRVLSFAQASQGARQ
jgi:hypothetical protein